MLRPATDSDLPAMRAWRNQEANRAVSLTQHEIEPAEHAAWWKRVTCDPGRQVLIFEKDGRALGVVNYFDITPTSASWGFYLDHDGTTADGTALVAWMQVMREAIDYAFASAPDGLGVDVLAGEVLAHNESVRATNRRFRFTEGMPETRDIDGSPVEVIPISLRREDRRPAHATRKEQS